MAGVWSMVLIALGLSGLALWPAQEGIIATHVLYRLWWSVRAFFFLFLWPAAILEKRHLPWSVHWENGLVAACAFFPLLLLGAYLEGLTLVSFFTGEALALLLAFHSGVLTMLLRRCAPRIALYYLPLAFLLCTGPPFFDLLLREFFRYSLPGLAPLSPFWLINEGEQANLSVYLLALSISGVLLLGLSWWTRKWNSEE